MVDLVKKLSAIKMLILKMFKNMFEMTKLSQMLNVLEYEL